MTESKPTDPSFPPLLTGHGVSMPDQPFLSAVNGARAGELEAGSVVWARNTSVMDWAIVLAPDVPLVRAMQMVPLGLVAAADCVGALTPPQVGLMFRWPATILVNGAEAGFAEAAASTTDPGAVPDWLVVRVMMRLRGDEGHEPGERPDQTSLAEEGCPDLTRTELIESYSPHFMTWLNTWTDDGFHPVHSAWTFKASDDNTAYSFDIDGRTIAGTFTGLDEDGGLLIKDAKGATSLISLAQVTLSREASS